MAPIAPMLAKAVPSLPSEDSVAGGLAYEPKWDGFRGIVTYDGAEVTIDSRGSKPLTRYFPELVEQFRAQLPTPCVLDGEIVVRRGDPGHERLDWDALSQRIHPAESRIKTLSEETPASFIAFDLLGVDGRSAMETPFSERRSVLEALASELTAPLHLTSITRSAAEAEDWFTRFEGAGLDGVVAKPLAATYQPGKRTMLKVKHHRTADVVAIGYRVHKSGSGVGSLLLGLYGDDGELHMVGGVSAFSDARRQSLVEELDPLVERDPDGRPTAASTERSRFSGSRDTSYVRLVPSRVLEVRYDQLEGDRFRHTVQFDRWRPDRDARSCTYSQLDVPVSYDLGLVIS
jgi:ATP-dependent DNA ligase